MGLFGRIFQTKEQSMKDDGVPSLGQDQPCEEKKRYKERIMIEWEDRTRSNEIYEDMSDYSSRSFDGYFVLNYRDADQNRTLRKRVYIPVYNIHRITIEVVEVIAK